MARNRALKTAIQVFRRPMGMNLLRRFLREEDGQGLVEYTLVVLMVTLLVWVAVKQSDLGVYFVKVWGRVVECVTTPLGCSA